MHEMKKLLFYYAVCFYAIFFARVLIYAVERYAQERSVFRTFFRKPNKRYLIKKTAFVDYETFSFPRSLFPIFRTTRRVDAMMLWGLRKTFLNETTRIFVMFSWKPLPDTERNYTQLYTELFSEKLPLFFLPTSPLEPPIFEASWIFLLLPYAISESTGLCKMFHAANEPSELWKPTFVKYYTLVAMVNVQNWDPNVTAI